jgi:catechol 2,3-dioxygenase-like lactoylglutathione lyase family enzyme
MAAPLRILAVTLTVPDLARADKFYRWVLAMKTSEEAVPEGTVSLGWGKEDRIVLVDADAPGAEEAITLRLPAMTVDAAATWLADRELVPERAVVPPADEPAARAAWPGAAIETATDSATHNRLLLTIRGPMEPRIDLHVALPAAVVGGRGTIGPFLWRSEDRSDLEIPGLLGVTTGAPDTEKARAFLATLGIDPIEDDAGPLGVGDHQWIVEEKDPAGIYGIAVVLQAGRIMDLVRTLEKLEARYRHDGNRLIAVDPAGRVLLVHGIKSG